MIGRRALCVTCCGPVSPEQTKKLKEDNRQLIKFTRQLVTLSEENFLIKNKRNTHASSSNRRRGTAENFGSEAFIKSFEQFENLSLCSECTTSLSSAVKAKRRMDEAEIYLRHMQLQVIKELRKLETQVDEFYLEMRKIENTVKNSDTSSLRNCIASGSSDKSSRNGEDIIAFRNQIENVVTELERTRMLKWTSELFDSKSAPPRRTKNIRSSQKRSSVVSTTSSEDKSDEEEDPLYFPEKDPEDIKLEQLSEPEEAPPQHSPLSYEPDMIGHNIPDPGILNNPADEGDEDGEELNFDEEEEPSSLLLWDENEANEEIGNLGDLPEPRKRLATRVIRTQWKLRFFQQSRQKGPPRTKWEKRGDYYARSTVNFEYNKEVGILTLGDFEVAINDSTNMLECSKCDYKLDFGTQQKTPPEQLMHQHIMRNHWDKFECPMCSKIKSTLRLYRQHVTSHASYVCNICDLVLSSEACLKAHKKRHVTSDQGSEPSKMVKGAKSQSSGKLSKNHVCHICNVRFKMKSSLGRHNQLEHSSEGSTKIFECEVCRKVFNRRDQLLRHKRTHVEVSARPLACRHCEMRFNEAYELRRHYKRNHLKNKS